MGIGETLKDIISYFNICLFTDAAKSRKISASQMFNFALRFKIQCVIGELLMKTLLTLKCEGSATNQPMYEFYQSKNR